MHERCREHPASLPPKASYYLLILLFLPLHSGPTAFFAASLVVGYWLLRRARRFYTLTPQTLLLERGWLLRQATCIPLSCITTLTMERPLWLRLVGATRVLVDTDGGTRRTADARLTIPNRHARLFLPDSDSGCFYRPRARRVWLLAVLSSDSFGGVLLLAAVVRQSSILLGEHIQQRVLDNLEAVADALVLIPRTAALVIIVLLCGWLAGTVRHLLRHLPFGVCRGTHTLTVYAGWLTRRIHCCEAAAIHYADRRQTLAACLLRRYTVYVSCTGYGKDKNTLAVLLPPGNHRESERELTALLPTLTPVATPLRPCRGAVWRYIRLPLILLASLPLCALLAGLLLPFWQELTRYLTLLGVFPCLWLLAVRIIGWRRAAFGYADGKYTLCYPRRLTLHQVTVPRRKVAALHLRQSFWQRRQGTCDVVLYSYHEGRHPHRVRHLSIREIYPIIYG